MTNIQIRAKNVRACAHCKLWFKPTFAFSHANIKSLQTFPKYTYKSKSGLKHRMRSIHCYSSKICNCFQFLGDLIVWNAWEDCLSLLRLGCKQPRKRLSNGIWTSEDCIVQIPAPWHENCAKIPYPRAGFDTHMPFPRTNAFRMCEKIRQGVMTDWCFIAKQLPPIKSGFW